jgi:hypothetical protein
MRKYLLLFTLGIILLSGCSSPELDLSTPELTFNYYMAGVNNYDDELMNRVSTRNFQEFLKDNKWDFKSMGIERIETEITEIVENNPNEVEVKYSVKLHYTSGKIQPAQDSIILVKEGDKWLVDRKLV